MNLMVASRCRRMEYQKPSRGCHQADGCPRNGDGSADEGARTISQPAQVSLAAFSLDERCLYNSRDGSLPCFLSCSRVWGGHQATTTTGALTLTNGSASASATPSAAGSSQKAASDSAGNASGGTRWTAVLLSALGCSSCMGRASTEIRGAEGEGSRVRKCEYRGTKVVR